MRPSIFLCCSAFATLIACSSRDPIVFVPWPPDSHYAWEVSAGGAAGFAVVDAMTRVGAARAVAQVRAVAAIVEPAASVLPAAEGSGGAGSPTEDGGAIDLNEATLAELDQLPRIGPALAQRIIEARPFRRVEDLRRVSGIGDATYRALAPRVTVTGR